MKPRLAYIVQLDLPGLPIKIGSTKNPLVRFDAFSHGTPVECRFVGVTIHGVEREAAMLAATKSAVIHGEWRYVTPELRALVADYFGAGEWFTHEPSAFDGEDIRRRVIALAPECAHYLGRKVKPRSIGYHWANAVLARSIQRDPLLPVHWAGFRRSDVPPAFEWPRPIVEAA